MNQVVSRKLNYNSFTSHYNSLLLSTYIFLNLIDNDSCIIAGNEFAISEMDHDDIDENKGRCFEPEPVDLPMGNTLNLYQT